MITAVPPWWEELTASPLCRELGISWRAPAEWDTGGDEEQFLGTMRTEADSALDKRMREGRVRVGSGPEVVRRAMGSELAAEWYLDPADPSRLWCALGDCYPAWLWVPVAPEPAALTEVLSHSHPTPALTRTDMPGFTRGFLGFRSETVVPHVYSGDLVEFNGHDLDRYFTGVQYAEQESWGSSCLDDPLRDDIGFVSPLVIAAASRNGNAKAQRLGRIPSMTWRTVHSRSYLSFEVHGRHAICAAVRYRPSPASHHPVVARLNQQLGRDFPHDLPLDAIGALNGFQFTSERQLAGALRDPEDPARLATAIHIHAALWAGDLQRTRRLREFAARPEPEVRLKLGQVAFWYGYRWLAEELALTETDPALREQLEDLVIQGGTADTYNAFDDYFAGVPMMVDDSGAPVETWSDDHDEEEEDPE